MSDRTIDADQGQLRLRIKTDQPAPAPTNPGSIRDVPAALFHPIWSSAIGTPRVVVVALLALLLLGLRCFPVLVAPLSAVTSAMWGSN